MSIAFVSIVASTAIALATIANGYFQHRTRLKHERELAFDNRSWDAKSAAHNEVIRVASRYRTVASHRANVLVGLEDGIRDLVEQESDLFVYATPQCLVDVRALVALLKSYEAEINMMDVFQMQALRNEKEQALDASDFENAARIRQTEKEAIQRIVSAVTSYDERVLRRASNAVMASARASLRGGV